MPRPFSRTGGCLLISSLLLLIACERRVFGVIVKKRVYLDGFYVHVPGKRATPVYAYPKPSPYPTAHNHPPYTKPAGNTTAAGSAPPATPPATQQTGVATSSSSANNDDASGSTGGIAGNEPNAGDTPAPPANGPGTGFLLPPDTASPPVALVDPAPSDSLPSSDTTAVAQQPPAPSKSRNAPDLNFQVLGFGGFIENVTGKNPSEPYSFAAGFGGRAIVTFKPQHALVADAGFRLDQYFIGQQHQKPFPLSQAKHDRERIAVMNLQLSAGYRYHFPEKENANSRWLDAAVVGDWAFRTSNVWKDFDRETTYADHSTMKMKFTGLHYLRKLNYGATLRFGGEWWSVFATYRLSRIWKNTEDHSTADLPRLTVGIEIIFGE